MSTNNESPWWDDINMCHAITKKGERCKNKIRKGFESELGGLVVFFTCAKHWNQENKIRIKKGLEILAYELP